MHVGRGSAEGEPTVCMCVGRVSSEGVTICRGVLKRKYVCVWGGGVLSVQYMYVGSRSAKGELTV